jgi:C-terminal processing protease CtpA/Prc
MAMTEPQREFTARDCHGNRARWNETTIAPTLHDTLRWWHLDQHRTYIQLDSFDGSLDLAAGFDTLLTEARTRHSQMLILDLRGNAGGALTSATALRDRFLRTHTQLAASRSPRAPDSWPTRSHSSATLPRPRAGPDRSPSWSIR